MAAAASKEDHREATLRRYNQVVYRLAALTWVITQVFDWRLLTMNVQELASSAVSRVARGLVRQLTGRSDTRRS